MLQLSYPLLLLLLPLPWLLLRWLPPQPSAQPALQVPFMARLARASRQAPQPQLIPRRLPLQWLQLGLIWLALLLALARPVWLGEPVVETRPGRDLLLAVDISGSMDTADMQAADTDGGDPITRLAALKTVLNQLVRERPGDRFGLIVFGSAPYLQLPFSQDPALFSQLLAEVKPPMAGPKTMLGDAIGLALKLFAASESPEKLLLLFTDGNDSGSQIEPLIAAGFAAQAGIKIHTIAVGDPATPGQPALDLTGLAALAERTGGQLFMARAPAELAQLQARLATLEPSQLQQRYHQPRQPLYHWPLAVALLVALAVHGWLGWQQWRQLRRPAAGEVPHAE